MLNRHRARRHLLAASLVVAIAQTTTALATAGEAPDPSGADPRQLEDARWQFVEGTAHYQGRRYAEALAAFERSDAIVASPNTELMIARCLRELGRKSDAVTAFERAEREARARASAGESKYAPTLDAARAEGAALRATLGKIDVHLAQPAGATVTVNGTSLPVSAAGDATLLHEPGTVTVEVRDAGGALQRQTVTVAGGGSVRMDFSGESTAPPPVLTQPVPPPPDASPRTSWAVPAAWIAGGVTLAGAGVLTGFGLSSQATYDDLAARCGPTRCGPADRAEADSGERAQTIANVGLGVAVVAAVATVVFVVVAVTSSR